MHSCLTAQKFRLDHRSYLIQFYLILFVLVNKSGIINGDHPQFLHHITAVAKRSPVLIDKCPRSALYLGNKNK